MRNPRTALDAVCVAPCLLSHAGFEPSPPSNPVFDVAVDSPFWGEDGYFRIKRGVNECNIEDNVLSSQDNAKWHGPGV